MHYIHNIPCEYKNTYSDKTFILSYIVQLTIKHNLWKTKLKGPYTAARITIDKLGNKFV